MWDPFEVPLAALGGGLGQALLVALGSIKVVVSLCRYDGPHECFAATITCGRVLVSGL